VTELDAFSTLGGNYLNWIEKVVDRSSFLKDGWFASALVTPPMFEVAHKNITPLNYKYEFNRYTLWHYFQI
jgi:hypothetical protein